VTPHEAPPTKGCAAHCHTLFVGKWHLGEAAAARPEACGLDETLGFSPDDEYVYWSN